MNDIDLNSSAMGTDFVRSTEGVQRKPQQTKPADTLKNGDARAKSGVDIGLGRYDNLIVSLGKARTALIDRLKPVLTNADDPMPEPRPLTDGSSKDSDKQSKLAAQISTLDERLDAEIFALQALIELIDL